MATSVENNVIRALADRLRLQIITLFPLGRLDTTHLVGQSGASRTGLSPHLRIAQTRTAGAADIDRACP